MANQVDRVIGKLDAIISLVEYFPMSIWREGNNYNNAFAFIMDILKQLGITDMDIVDKIIELIFNVPNAVELVNGVGNYSYKKISKPTEEQLENAIVYTGTNDTPPASFDSPPLYKRAKKKDNGEIETDKSGNTKFECWKKKSPIDGECNSDFLNGLENTLKIIIADILTSLLSCSINPYIPSRIMDQTGSTWTMAGGGLSVPLSALDPFSLLRISPTSDAGRNFYNVDEDNNSIDLYKTQDLNAFIWYAMNRGSIVPQSEKNKMMWDSRVFASNHDKEPRISAELWNAWYNSKQSETGILYTSGASQTYSNAIADGKNKTTDLDIYPIVQLKRDTDVNTGSSERRLRVWISGQSFFKEGKIINKNIYQFNAAYLRNIRLFSPRVILGNMMNDLLNGSIVRSFIPDLGPNEKLFEAKLEKIIGNLIEVADETVTDCYYSFSNEDFEEMLKNSELQRYDAVETNNDGSPAVSLDNGYGLEKLNEINSTATSNEKISTISKTVYELSTISTNGTTESNSNSESDPNWVNKIIWAFIKPLIRSVISPQLMLLFLINFDVMGLVNLEKIMSSNNKIMTLFFNKMLGVFVNLIKKIINTILVVLVNWCMELMKGVIASYLLLVAIEELEDWMLLLAEAIKCMPTFKATTSVSEIDDVTYADITKSQDTPETTETC